MHRSRLGTLVIDCQTDQLDTAAAFWAQAFGWPAAPLEDPADANYRQLKTPPQEVSVLVQAVSHPSRVHVDIETDDIEAEVARLEALGARRVAQVKRWWVMEAPTGQRFCVVRPQRPDFATHARTWNDDAATAPSSASSSPSRIAERLAALGLALPPPLTPPPGVVLPFQAVRLVGQRAFVSGHGPLNADGSLARPLGKLGRELNDEQGYEAARLTALAILASLQRALGNLDRIRAWSRVFGMVNSAPGFTRQPGVINGFSDLILELFGPEAGAHARSAVGMAELPFDIPVEIEAEVEFTG